MSKKRIVGPMELQFDSLTLPYLTKWTGGSQTMSLGRGHTVRRADHPAETLLATALIELVGRGVFLHRIGAIEPILRL